MIETKNSKGLIVMIVSRAEQQKINSRHQSVCDYCNEPIQRNGFIIPVLNSMYCSKCTAEFEQRCQNHPEDHEYEKNTAEKYRQLLK